MKLSISKSVNLEEEYSNHSIRATVISTLDYAGFEARHIIQLSSHKSEATAKEYARKCPDNKKKEMFQSLSNVMDIQPKCVKRQASSTVAVPPKIPKLQDVKENLPNFDLQELEDYDTIDDAVLADLILDFPTESNAAPSALQKNTGSTSMMINATAPATMVHSNQNHQINTQFNTINQIPFGRIPPMYFPNSNVTISYNFGK